MIARHKFEIAKLARNKDARELPVYSIAEAAHYLCIPKQTVRAWVMGTTYSRHGKRTLFKPVIHLPLPGRPWLSFFNLAEAHVLRALRTEHAIQLPAIRRALNYVTAHFGWKRPLIQQEFKTDGLGLFVEKLGKVLEASAGGQVIMSEVMAHLSRLEWEGQLVARLYPFTRRDARHAPKSVLIDPRYAFGKPILAESRVTTLVIAERYKAGESVDSLARDYGCTALEIEEGLRCEIQIGTAA